MSQTGHLPSGRTDCHGSTITGGTDDATYPSSASVGMAIGTQPGERLGSRMLAVQGIVGSLPSSLPDCSAAIKVAREREPFKASGHRPLLHAGHAAARGVRDINCRRLVSTHGRTPRYSRLPGFRRG